MHCSTAGRFLTDDGRKPLLYGLAENGTLISASARSGTDYGYIVLEISTTDNATPIIVDIQILFTIQLFFVEKY